MFCHFKLCTIFKIHWSDSVIKLKQWKPKTRILVLLEDPVQEEAYNVKWGIDSNLFFTVCDVSCAVLNSIVVGNVYGPLLAKHNQEVRNWG
jgi:hypothetical protein